MSPYVLLFVCISFVGRSMRLRQRNQRISWPLEITEPTSQNYFPINSAVQIRDSVAAFTVLTDRAQVRVYYFTL